MLELQYFRGILLVNNAVAATISFCSQNWDHDTIFVLGGFLLGSWIMNAIVLVYTLYTFRMFSMKDGWIRVPVHGDDYDEPYDVSANQPKIGWKMSLFFKLWDVIFILALLVLMIMGFVIYPLRADTVMACTGGIVAIIVHAFCFLASFDWKILRTYTVKLVVIRRDQQIQITPLFERAEDQQVSKEPAMAASERDPSPISISPRSYRGSPSSKPSTGSSKAQTAGPIKLTDATEADALIADTDY